MQKLIITIIMISQVTNVIAQDMNVDTTMAKMYLHKAAVLTVPNVDSATYYLDKANKIIINYPESVLRVRYLLILGSLKKFLGKYNEAEQVYTEMYMLASKINHEYYLLAALYSQATILSEMRAFQKSIPIYLNLEKICISKKRKGVILYLTYFGLSYEYFKLNDANKAAYYCKKIYPLLKKTADSLAYYDLLADILSLQPNNEKSSHQYYLKALKLATSLNDTYTYIELCNKIGNYYLIKKKYKEALKYTTEALKLSVKLDNKRNESITYHIMGKIYYELKQYGKARIYLEKSLKGAVLTKERTLEYDVLIALGQLYKKMEMYQLGFEAMSSALIIKDTLIGIEKQKLVLKLEIENDVEKKEQEIALKESENKILSKRTYEISILLLITILLLVWQMITYLRAKKISKEITLQKKQIEKKAHLLRQSNAAKDKLFAIISHDLRSPINNLISYLYLLDDNYTPTKGYIDKLRHKLDDTQFMLDNLLEWADYQIKDTTPHLQQVNVDMIVRIILNQFDEAIKSKEITVINELIEEQVVKTDKNYLQIILRNIVSNAVKFTSPNGIIKIKVEDETKIVVKNTGTGIDKEKLKTIFSYPKPSLGTNNEKGTGLGLTLCKELMEKQGGTIHITSKLGFETSVKINFPNSL